MGLFGEFEGFDDDGDIGEGGLDGRGVQAVGEGGEGDDGERVFEGDFPVADEEGLAVFGGLFVVGEEAFAVEELVNGGAVAGSAGFEEAVEVGLGGICGELDEEHGEANPEGERIGEGEDDGAVGFGDVAVAAGDADGGGAGGEVDGAWGFIALLEETAKEGHGGSGGRGDRRWGA